MNYQRAFGVFYAACLSDIQHPESIGERLIQAGFPECERRPAQEPGEPRIDRILHHDGSSDFAFSYILSEAGAVSDGALILPESEAALTALTDFVMALPNLVETTEETRIFMAFAPERVSWPLVETRFWTSKAPGQVGLNISIGPAIIGLPGGHKSLALTLSANPQLEDAPDASELALLTGPGSRLAKFVLIFSEIARKACPDQAQIIWAADAYGYRGDVPSGARSFVLNGGFGPNPRSEDITSAIHVNCDTDADFELALSFNLDERLTSDTIRAALFDALALSSHARHGDKAVLELADGHYVVSHLCESAAFGNHVFLLQK